METIFHVKDLETGCISEWTIHQILEEINRDHSYEFTPYNEYDLLEGWFEWCEGNYFSLVNITEGDLTYFDICFGINTIGEGTSTQKYFDSIPTREYFEMMTKAYWGENVSEWFVDIQFKDQFYTVYHKERKLTVEEQFIEIVSEVDFQKEILPLIEDIFQEEYKRMNGDINQFADLWSCVFYKGYSFDVNFFDDEFHDEGENLILCTIYPNYYDDGVEKKLLPETFDGTGNILTDHTAYFRIKNFSKNRLDYKIF